uniref:DUF1618 domain-containing protein n=1 Tax=Setaria viridis TaxID=4556 RepID=A0A4U6WJD0_SETVI|nr:hypothetical protein SEVIR_1G357800v2 [Setaria viridis]
MPKRKGFDERCGDVKRPAPQRKQHLYLLLDDWERGYSVRRLDTDAFDSDAGANPPAPPERFAEPPVARIEAEHANDDRNFVSHGTKIFAMQPGEASPAIPAFDARTLGLSLCPWPSSSDRDYGLPFFASAAGKLFVFTDAYAAYLGDQPPPGSKAPWAWTAMEARPPFYASQVRCYALHPDGRTLFVSAGSRRRHRSGTFSLDDRLEWTRHGDWLLPFRGQAYFDAELEAWVGLCGERDGGDGRLCACDVTPVAAELTSPPSPKLGEDKLFRRNPELHLGAKLVEFMFHKDDEHLLRDHKVDVVDAYYNCPPQRRRVLYMTTFGLKYNKEGQLRTTLQRAHACKMYKRPHDSGGSTKPLAFWL